MRLKVCGMTRIDQLRELDEMGVTFAGLIFYPKSPRCVFAHELTGRAVKQAELKILKVGVFVDATEEEILKQVRDFGLDMVQLHGQESPDLCSRISGNVPIIKAFRISEKNIVSSLLNEHLEASDMFLFDTAVAAENGNTDQRYGGTGHKFNWDLLKGQKIGKPFFLSGGIGPDNAATLKDFCSDPVATELFAVDINSRFESAPGVKNMEQVRRFINDLKAQGI